jgi:hypothetical protein
MNYLTSTRSQIFAVTPLGSASIIPQWTPLLHATTGPIIRPHSSYMASLRHSLPSIHQAQYNTPTTTIPFNQLLRGTLLLLRRSCQRALHRPALCTNPITETLINHQSTLSTALVRLVAEYRCSMVCSSSLASDFVDSSDSIHSQAFISKMRYISGAHLFHLIFICK